MTVTSGNFAPSGSTPQGDSARLLKLSDDPIRELGEARGGAVIDAIVDAVGRSSRTLDIDTALEKTFAKFAEIAAAGTKSDLSQDLVVPDLGDPATWWKNHASDSVVAPIGRQGATDIAFLRLDSGNLTGALIVGRPGSGKSTLIHTILAGLTTMYGPDELELYLLDFKEGVEFADYAEYSLPHAACIAVESERELGMNVLVSLTHELKRRAEAFKAAKVQNIGSYRSRGHELTRIVVFFDEFQVLFNEDDRIGQESARAMDLIIKQGRSHGIHIVLSSQTLSGMIAMNKQSLQLLNVRVLLPSSTEDAMTVMDDHNPAHKLIKSRGEGILNNASGRESANIQFNGAYEKDQVRRDRMKLLRTKAVDEGFLRTPRIFESGTQAHLEAEDRAKFAPTPPSDPSTQASTLSLRPGTAFALSSDLRIELRREAGSNIIHVDRNTTEQLVGTVAALWLSARASNPYTTHEVIGFSHVPPAMHEIIRGLADEGIATFSGSKSADSALQRLGAELDRRQEEQDFSSAPIVLTLLGIQKARDLDPNSYSSSLSFDDDSTVSLHEQIERIAAEGPEVGIHIIATVDTCQGLEKRFSRKLQHEFSTRLVGSMSAEDIGSLTSPSVRVRPHQGQMLYYDIDTGATVKYLPYVLNDTNWISTILPTGARQ
ncbi:MULTISPECIES: FtsK/SpoIIIE domain-containing protein [Brevibacterium]|nr:MULTISPECIES: FtsK/SpoIIIE domain-containing protein [Brevibacterium]